MITNKLILYCGRLEQAMLWDVCKQRRCATSNCLFKKIGKHFGEELWSEKPIRLATIKAAEEQLEVLTQPIPLRRTPVLDPQKPSDIAQPVCSQDHIDKPVMKRAPVKSLNDILRNSIEETVKSLM